jgi:hypothetical protein
MTIHRKLLSITLQTFVGPINNNPAFSSHQTHRDRRAAAWTANGISSPEGEIR